MAQPFLLLHHFTFHFWNGLKLFFIFFISSLFLILAFLTYLPLQMESINYLTKKEFLTYLVFIIRVYCCPILLYPFLLPNKCFARLLGNCQLFYRFFCFQSYFLIHDTLSALEKEKNLNETLYSFHYTLLSHNLFNRLWRSARLRKTINFINLRL